MIISLLFQEPLLFVVWIAAITYGITVHEFSHVLAAYAQGDDTGSRLGRLTLNPFAHIDPLGMMMLLFVGFGWGKPAPFNPYNLKYRRWGEVIVSLAGPLSNLISIVIFAIAARALISVLGPMNLLIQFLMYLVLINIVLMVFNLIPIPPLDGSRVLFEVLPDKYRDFKDSLARNGSWILIGVVLADSFLNLHLFSGIFQYFFRLAATFIGG